MILRTATIILGVILLTGCCCLDPSDSVMAPPWYPTPWMGPSTPEAIISYAEQQAEVEAPDPEKNLQLCDMIDIALRNNPKTQQSWLLARSSAYELESTKSSLYPNLFFQEDLIFSDSTFGGGGEVAAGNGNTGISDSSVISAGPGYQQQLASTLSSSWLLLDFGGRDASIESARQALYAVDWGHNRVIQDVMIAVIGGYYSHASAVSAYNAVLADLRDAEETYDAAKQRYKAGVNVKLDVLQAKTALVNVLLEVERLKGQVNITSGELAFAMGFSADTFIPTAELPEELPLEKLQGDVSEWMEVAKRARPDLKSAYADFKKHWHDIRVSWSEGMPTLFADGLFQRTTNIHHPKQNGHFYSGTLGLEVPLFNGGLYWYNWKSSKEKFEASWAAYRDKESAVLLDVLTTYYTFMTAIESVKFSEEFLKTAQEAFDLALGSYKQGVNTILDLLNAQSSLANARSMLIQSRTQWAISLAGIAYATGTLYQ